MKYLIRFTIIAVLCSVSLSVFALDNEECKFEALDLKDKIPVRAEGKIISLFPQDAEVTNSPDAGGVVAFFFTFGLASISGSSYLKLSGGQASVRTTEKVPEFLDLVVPLEDSPGRILSLARLTVKDSSRIVQIARIERGYIKSSDGAREFGENAQVPLVMEKVSEKCLWRGGLWAHYKIKPAVPLEKGEYAFLIYRRMYDFGVD